MISFILPRLHPKIYESIDVDSNSTDFVFHFTKQYYLVNIEKNIKKNQKEWDVYKKFTNTYDFLYSKIPFENIRVTDIDRPRSFFIFTEILYKFHESILEKDDITSFHLSDYNNGMMNALIEIRKNNVNDKYTTNKCNDLESDGESSLSQDILNIDHFIETTRKYKSSIDYVTADITKSELYDSQISAQICYALCIQKINGNFTFKMIDAFSKISIDIIALVSSMYEEVYITKPLSCKCYDSEIIIVCKNFLHKNSDSFYPYILSHFRKKSKDRSISFFNQSCIDEFFSNKTKEYITILTQYQIEHIHNILNNITTDKNKKLQIIMDSDTTIELNQTDFEKSKIHYLKSINIKKCILFCKNHHLDVNKYFLTEYA
jgi:hypothetical protein